MTITTATPKGGTYAPGLVAQAQDAAVFERSGAGVYLTIEWITAYIQAALGNGAAITFGSTAPANTVGEQDDVFFNIGTGEVLSKGASAWTVQANFALDTEVTAAITAAITAHSGAADPHPIYLTQAEATALYKPLTTDDSAATGLRLTLLTAVTGTPANGQIIANNATLSSITQLLISETDRNGAIIESFASLLADTLRIQVQNEQSEDIYCYFRVNGTVADNGSYRTVPVTFVSKPTAITTLTQLSGTGEVSVGLFGAAGGTNGTNGTNGVTSGQVYVLTTGTTTPSGNVRFASNTLFLHESDRSTPTAVNLTTLWQNLTPGSVIQIIDETAPTNYANYTLGSWAGNPPKNNSIYELPATSAGANGTIADNTNVRISFGLKGAAGTPGSGSTITVQEVDGTPSGSISSLVVPNNSLAIAGSTGTLTFNPSGGSAQGVELRQVTAQSLNNGSLTYLTYPAPASDPLGLWNSANSSRLTASSTGWYAINCFVVIDTTATINNFAVLVAKNRSVFSPQNRTPNQSGGNNPGRTVSALLYLTAGDYIELAIFVDAASLSTSVVFDQNSTFSMVKL